MIASTSKPQAPQTRPEPQPPAPNQAREREGLSRPTQFSIVRATGDVVCRHCGWVESSHTREKGAALQCVQYDKSIIDSIR